MEERLYLVTYDIADDSRWRKVFRLMQGHGEWLQLSVFQCRLSGREAAVLMQRLDEVIDHGADHVLVIELGAAESVSLRVKSLGKAFRVVVRETVVV
jgi:CRISPR-associated protein Cas2